MTTVTFEMRLAGCRILHIMEAPNCERNQVIDNLDFPNRDLLLKVFARELHTVDAIYIAMERAREVAP